MAEMQLWHLIRAVRQGFFFGVEARLPYALVSMARPRMFDKKSRGSLAEQMYRHSEEIFSHGWILARIAVFFKSLEWFLANTEGPMSDAAKGSSLKEWHTFLAGCVSGYIVMVRDGSHPRLKRQINMAIGIRTLYALSGYLLRKGLVPFLNNTSESADIGRGVWYSVMWGTVMWHWRHHSTGMGAGEMDKSQVNHMSMIYSDGDTPGIEKWTTNNYLYWLIALFMYSRIFRIGDDKSKRSIDLYGIKPRV